MNKTMNKLNAKSVLLINDLPEDELYWKNFYFNNVALIRQRTGGSLPGYATWGQLKAIMYRADENQQFESCMEYSELKNEAERDAASEDEYGVEEWNCEKDIGSESHEAVMEEGSPWDDCDDFENRYRNIGL